MPPPCARRRPGRRAPTLAVNDPCAGAEACINDYLWSLYERAPKVDTVKETEKKKVTVEKNGKTRTITKTETKLVAENFAWKDPQAAEKVSMPLKDYVIGGMDQQFKLNSIARCVRSIGPGSCRASPALSAMITVNHSQADCTRRTTGHTTAAAYVAVTATDLLPTSSASRARPARSAGPQPSSCGSGSTRTAKNSELAGPI